MGPDLRSAHQSTSLPSFLTTMVGAALELPRAIERKLSGGGEGREDHGVGEFLRAVSTPGRRSSRREEEEEWEAGFNGATRHLEEVVKQESLVTLVTCSCGKLCLPPVSQCRKGHVFCR